MQRRAHANGAALVRDLRTVAWINFASPTPFDTSHEKLRPKTTDLCFARGKVLLAISQSSEDGPVGNGLSFPGDAEHPAVNLFSAAQNIADEEDADSDDDAEPEDDFNAAWETEDGADEDVQLNLADTYIAFGDASLETDYEARLALKGELFPRSSHQIAEVHYKLSMVLDLTSGRLGDAITHGSARWRAIECRLAELASPSSAAAAAPRPIRRARANRVRDDLVGSMSAAQIEAEAKELAGLKDDPALKAEELKTRPEELMKKMSLVVQALDTECNAHVGANRAGSAQVVNDLTSTGFR
ncbi:hypothetical protein B0H13DRAFT_1890315 [Mycena leptocephala]|nr:hypothetical protein B0H13DRAFT_1890315 [Mycena leptocephala]